MSGINIPNPVAWRFYIPSEDCFIYLTNEPKNLDGCETLITSDQAEAYKDACVKESLEEVADIADQNNAFHVYDAIRVLIPEDTKK